MTLLELLTELEQKSKAPRREFCFKFKFGPQESSSQITTVYLYSKPNHIHVQELSSVPTDKLIQVCKVLVEKLKRAIELAECLGEKRDPTWSLEMYEAGIRGASLTTLSELKEALTTAEKILKGEM